VPYPAYNYIISLNHATGFETPLGGFSDVSGLTQKRVVTYRVGNQFGRNFGSGAQFGGAAADLMQKVGGIHTTSDVTLKRGVVSAGYLWNWVAAARGSGGAGKLDATVTLRNEQGQPVQSWKLSKATPVRYTGPTLGGKGSGEVAMEELILSAEAIEIVPPH
jgi:phage tail-like protein